MTKVLFKYTEIGQYTFYFSLYVVLKIP